MASTTRLVVAVLVGLVAHRPKSIFSSAWLPATHHQSPAASAGPVSRRHFERLRTAAAAVASDDDDDDVCNPDEDDDDVCNPGEMPSFIMLDRPFSITDLLMMRTIQTQRHYYMELRNEPVSNWLSNFADHSHLDRGMLWHSVLGLRCSLEDYLSQMVATDDVTITVKYGIGVGWNNDSPVPLSPDEAAGESDDVADAAAGSSSSSSSSEGGGEVSEAAEAEARRSAATTGAMAEAKENAGRSWGPSDADGWRGSSGRTGPASVSSRDEEKPEGYKHLDVPWASAAASRRRNPYLQNGPLGQGQRSYNEVIQPRMVAQNLMMLLDHLRNEFVDDLTFIAAQSATDAERRARAATEASFDENAMFQGSGDGGVDVGSSSSSSSDGSDGSMGDAAGSAGDGGAAAGVLEDLSSWDDGQVAFREREATPLRRLNFELLERAVIFCAGQALVLSLERAAAEGGNSKAAAEQDAQYLRRFLGEWRPALMGQGFSAVGDKAFGLSVPEAVQLTPVAGLLLEALSLRPPVVGAGGALTDPPALAQKLLLYRRDAASALAEELKGKVDESLAEVRRKSLEKTVLAQ
jgi:hypothetical protein